MFAVFIFIEPMDLISESTSHTRTFFDLKVKLCEFSNGDIKFSFGLTNLCENRPRRFRAESMPLTFGPFQRDWSWKSSRKWSLPS